MDSASEQEPALSQASEYSSSEEEPQTENDKSLGLKEEKDSLSLEIQDNSTTALQNGLDGSPTSAADSGTSVDHSLVSKPEDHSDCSDVNDVSDGDKAQTNGDIFSPDSADMVTIICKADTKSTEETDRGGGDGSDTHSDSIETLEEESPHDDSQDQLSDAVLKQIYLTSQRPKGEDVFEAQTREDAALAKATTDGGGAEDSRSTDSHEVLPDTDSQASAAVLRPESLSLPRPLQYYERNRSASAPQHENAHAKTVRAEASGGHQRTRSEAIDIQAVRVRGDLSYGDDVMSRSLPYGTLTRKGDMVEFVADDLTEKIKRSSPMSRADSGSMGSRRSSQRSLASTSSATSVATSSGMSRSPSSLLTQSPDAAPPIDPNAIMELEMAARRVADNVDLMMGNLRNNLHKMSAITVGCSEAYKTSVDITCESVDSSIKSMYALMAKCEELSKTMTPVYQIASQIKEIKRLLERFENQLSEKS